MMKKTEKNMDLLLENFAGEIVEVIINKDIELTEQTEESLNTMKSSLSTKGYLTDLDDSFLYLGYEPNSIHQAINRDFVVYIGLAEEEDVETLMDGPQIKPGNFN